MQIIVRGKNLTVTNPLQEYTVKKVARVAKYFKNIQEALVELEVLHQKNIARNQVAHITLWAKGTILRSEETAGDLYSAIDLTIAKLERQLKKYKEKKVASTHERKLPKKSSDIIEKPLTEDIPEISEIKKISPKPMTLEEALLEAKVLKSNYFAFKNAETGQFNVLYRLKDNRFGLLELA